MSVFPVKSFRQALQDTKSLHSKLSKNFVVECKRHNMVMIQGITEQFVRIFSSKQNIKTKVNAMYAIQYFVELAEYPIMTLFQVYVLPIVSEIVLFRSNQQTQQGISQYFLVQGYAANTPNIKQLSRNYITFARDFVFNCALIKPYRTFEANQMNQPSQFKRASIKLSEANISQRDKAEEQRKSIQISRKQFLMNLSKFDNDSEYYINYYMKKVEQYIINGSKFRQPLDFKKIMKYGDVFLTSQAIGHCCQALQNNNFQFKKNALLLIHEFVLWGDIEAIMMINYAQYIEQIYNRVSQVGGNLNINAGEQIYPQILGQKQSKRNFYIQFLKFLHIWAISLPHNNFDKAKNSKDQDQQFSPVFILYTKLKEQRQFKFPQNPYLPKHKRDLQQNLEVNNQRNNLILRQLQQNAQDDTLSLSMSKRSMKPINKFEKYKSRNSLIKQQKQSQLVTASEIGRCIKQAEGLLGRLVHKIEESNIKEAEEILLKLNDFGYSFQGKLQTVQQSISEDKLQNLYRQGAQIIDQIQSISDHFEDFKDQKINLMKLQELVKNQLKKQMEARSSRYVQSYRSKRSKRSTSNNFGSNSQHFFHNNKSMQLKNYSINRHKVTKDQSQHRNTQLNQSQIKKQKEGHSQISRSSNSKVKTKNKDKQNQSQQQKSQQQNSYNFQIQDYGFRQVGQQNPVKSNGQSFQLVQSSKKIQTNKTKRLSEQVSDKKKSDIYIDPGQRVSDSKIKLSKISSKSSRKSNIYTDPECKISNSKISLSKVSSKSNNKPYHQQRQSQKPSPSPSKGRISERSAEESQKKESNLLRRASKSNQSNLTKSLRHNNSQSLIITSENVKKSNMPSEDGNIRKSGDDQIIQSHSKNQTIKYSSHQILSETEQKSLASFNLNKVAGFSKQPTSSVNRISSIEQKKFKFQMLNSQDRQIFDDYVSSKGQINEEHRKIKQEVNQEQNPGFGIVFRNKSYLKNSKVQSSKLNKNVYTHEQLRYNLSPRISKQGSRQNSQVKQSKLSENKTSQNQKRIISEHSGSSHHENSQVRLRKDAQIASAKTYSNQTHNKMQISPKKRQSIDNSLHKSTNSRKSLKRSQRKSQIKQGLNIGSLNVKAVQGFNLSSFSDSSKDTPRILQRSKNYYQQQQESEYVHPSKYSIYLKKNTSPKHQRISFANNSKTNIQSRITIKVNGQQGGLDKSNLTPSQVPRNRTEIEQKIVFRQISVMNKQKQKIRYVLSSQKSRLKSGVQNTSSRIYNQIQSLKEIQNMANKQLQEIKKLQGRLQKVQNDSRYFMQFQRRNIQSPEVPRFILTPRSPRFRDHNHFSSFQNKQRVSFLRNPKYMSPRTKLNFDISSSFSRQYLVTPEGKLIKKKNYQKYFVQLKFIQNGSIRKAKKHLLRNKQIVHQNQHIQIGTTILRQRNRLKIIYFITAKVPIQKFQCLVQEYKRLRIQCTPNILNELQVKKQYKMYVSCEIVEFPYILPKVKFTYRNDRKTVLLGQGSIFMVPETKIEVLLPCYFIKFIQITQISSPQMSQLLEGRQVYRTQQFPLNHRIIRKPHQINNYIPNLSLLSQTNAVTIYSGKASFFNHKFIFKLNFKINHFMFIQGTSIQSQEKHKFCQNILQWFLVCLQELFIKEMSEITHD